MRRVRPVLTNSERANNPAQRGYRSASGNARTRYEVSATAFLDDVVGWRRR